MMMRSLLPHASVAANFSQNILRNNYIHLSQRHYQTVCAAAKHYCSYKRNQFRILDTKATVLYRPSSVEFHILQQHISSFRSQEESKCSGYSCDPTLKSVALQSKFYYSTSNENEGNKSKEQIIAEDGPKKLSIVQRFKAMLKDYWHVLVPVHIVTSIGWFGGFYYLATSGIDIPALMESLNFSEGFVKPFRDSSMGYIAVSYGLYKIATPIRYTVTVGGTSIAIRVLKKRGLVHPWPINFKWLKNPMKKKES